MKILHIALGTPEFDRCARELGHETLRIEWRRYFGGKRPDASQVPAFQRAVIAEAELFMPDIVFAQLQTPDVVTNDTFDALRELGAFVVNWSGDVRSPIPSWYLATAPHVDVTSFSNQTDVDAVIGKGFRSEYLQIGYDETIYSPGVVEHTRRGVVFLGNHYAGVFPETDARSAMVKRMREEFATDFTLRGGNWHKHIKGTSPAEEVDIYRRALVAINWDHFNRPMFASDRILRAQACGCAVVSNHYEGIETEHPDVVATRSLDEMVDRVRDLLSDPDHAKQVGQWCASNVLERHTWHKRIQTILSWKS